ncbi:endonuclease [Aequorivita sp. F47161]|uniref:Endonuclease n=1 Tax=Aequorivita vitellina TaxID=2874475 RepID=A0A9X1U9Z8_9FLAO|nr:endonuclease [Aequorivita vitellina]MCG2419106.1 endonuclease [Aequorivita vitellina]
MKKKISIIKLTAVLVSFFFFGNTVHSALPNSEVLSVYFSDSLLSNDENSRVEFAVFSEDTIPLKNLVQNYKPQHVLSYDEARAVMYTQIYNINDTVSCMYSGYKLPLSHTQENPVLKLMKLNPFNSIIAEHSYPKSKGASNGNAKSDMHHLFPVRLSVNVSRYNHPFGDVTDEECDVWYTADDKYKSKPDEVETFCAKEGNKKFEPQDSFKGNVARAVFYFYTMYREEADLADDSFFELQRETLLAWHKQDPVDALELKRTLQIAAYQSGKANPFVLDETLAERLYDYKHGATPPLPR